VTRQSSIISNLVDLRYKAVLLPDEFERRDKSARLATTSRLRSCLWKKLQAEIYSRRLNDASKVARTRDLGSEFFNSCFPQMSRAPACKSQPERALARSLALPARKMYRGASLSCFTRNLTRFFVLSAGGSARATMDCD